MLTLSNGHSHKCYRPQLTCYSLYMNSLSGPDELNEDGVVSVTVTGMVFHRSHCPCEHRDPPELGRACSTSDYSVSKIKIKFYD